MGKLKIEFIELYSILEFIDSHDILTTWRKNFHVHELILGGVWKEPETLTFKHRMPVGSMDSSGIIQYHSDMLMRSIKVSQVKN